VTDEYYRAFLKLMRTLENVEMEVDCERVRSPALKMYRNRSATGIKE
jgi:hypothetical protein